MNVTWKVQGIFKADAQKCFEEIGGDGVTPEDVLNIAKDESTELHKCFEWDDTAAAEKYRLSQARSILQMIVVVPEKEEVTPRRVFQISSERNVYQPLNFFVKNEDEYQTLLLRAIGELKALATRYQSLEELRDIFELINLL